MTPFEKARKQFNTYAAMDAPHLPPEAMSAWQVYLFRWTQSHVPKHTLPSSVENVLGITEEAGELHEAIGKLAHLELNVSQGRRYGGLSEEELRAKAADAIADIGVFLMNYCTARRLDFGTLLTATIEEVTQRDWKARPDDAHLGGIDKELTENHHGPAPTKLVICSAHEYRHSQRGDCIMPKPVEDA